MMRFALVISVSLAVLGAGQIAARAADARPDLTGVVKSQSGQPVTNASIFIYTAGPRLGAGLLCPSCYLDCRKSAKSGLDGQFKIEALDSNLVFQVLVVAPGHVPTFFNKVDPLKGPLEATLPLRTATNIPPSQVILGRVFSTEKRPVPNAVVSVNSTTIGNTTSSRPPQGTDPLAITDERGEFSLASQGKFDAMNLRIEARGYANANFAEVRPGPKRREFIITEGAALTGRVMFEGKPLKNVTIGVVGVDHSMGNFTGDFVISTGGNGRFLFANLLPDREYALYGLMASVGRFGALPLRTVRVKGDGSKTDAGDLVVVPGHRLSGQVKLADSAPIPEHTRLLLGRSEAWDTLTVELPADGRFEFTNVPTETLLINTRVSGYRLAGSNVSLDCLNPYQLVGRLDGDKTNLTVLLELGKELAPDYSTQPDEERPEKLPLCGAEGKRTIPNAVTLSGQVLDAETGAPLPRFRITPGLQPNPDFRTWVEWYRSKAIEGTNGTFGLEISGKAGPIVLMAEADGYLPARSEALTRERTKTSIQLKRGVGPHGTLLLPDGKPANGVTVCYIVAGEQSALTGGGTISVYRGRGSFASLTDSDGKFSFAPKLGEGVVFAAGAGGFAHCSTVELAAKGELTLQPWARVRGRLVQNGKPVAGENVDLGWPAGYSFDRPQLNLHGTRTDDDGRFALEHVPPGELQLTTRIPLRAGAGSGWTNHSQRKFTMKPGEDLDLGTVEKSSPPKKDW
ncbi:MAG: hypothetical protein ABSA97_13190 [Verrucomicrobiia bacterium]